MRVPDTKKMPSDAAFVATLAQAGTEWQHEHLVTAKIIGRFRRGCIATLAGQDGVCHEVRDVIFRSPTCKNADRTPSLVNLAQHTWFP